MSLAFLREINNSPRAGLEREVYRDKRRLSSLEIGEHHSFFTRSDPFYPDGSSPIDTRTGDDTSDDVSREVKPVR